MRTACLNIHTDAMIHNLGIVHKLAPHANIMAMVKADAYGHGIEYVVPALVEYAKQLKHESKSAPQPTQLALGVATFLEASLVRAQGWAGSLGLIEGVFGADEWQMCHSLLQAQCVIHCEAQVAWALADVPAQSSPTRTVWLKLNTGMNRLGFDAHRIVPIAKQLHAAGFDLILTSHFANADDRHHPLNQSQIDLFNRVLHTLRAKINPNIQASLCNSAGTINFPDCHYDWVRPGIMIYGSSPLADGCVRDLNLRPAMTFCAKIMAMHWLVAGEGVGYGSRFTCERRTLKGIISVGYGDGYPRVVNEDAWVAVLLDKTVYRCPVIGRVAMDMIAVDLTDLAAVTEPQIGDDVILWGDADKGHPSVDDVASWAGTIGYELLCRVTGRPVKCVINLP